MVALSVAKLVCSLVGYHMGYHLVGQVDVAGIVASSELDSKDCTVSYLVVYNHHLVGHGHHLHSNHHHPVFLFSDYYHAAQGRTQPAQKL